MWPHRAEGWTSDINKMIYHHFLPLYKRKSKCPGCGQMDRVVWLTLQPTTRGHEHAIHFVKKCPYLRFHPHPALTGGCSCSPRWEEHIFSWSHTDGRWSSWHSSPGFWKVSWQRDKEKNTWKKVTILIQQDVTFSVTEYPLPVWPFHFSNELIWLQVRFSA